MTGLSVYAEFPGGFGIKELMPIHRANRGYRAWQYIEPIMMMLYGGGRHAEDLPEGSKKLTEDEDFVNL